MSGTSMDGVDASIIQTDGKSKYKAILDKYFEYPSSIYLNLIKLRDKIKKSKDLKKHQKQIKAVEKEITIFHAKAVNEILKKNKINVDFIGFHGQTIFHNGEEKISKQLGDGKLLSKLTKKKVVYDFRQNDLKNGGRGAPLAPVFHAALVKNKKIPVPITIWNIGGITNYTHIYSNKRTRREKSQSVALDHQLHSKGLKILDPDGYCEGFASLDIGPGNCLIDQWIRIKSKEKYDKGGRLARSGKINKKLLDRAIYNFKKKVRKLSYDVSDFNISFVKGLSLKDGAATLTEYTAELLYEYFVDAMDGAVGNILSGGGRKNKTLIKSIENKIKKWGALTEPLKYIDDYGIDGDFIESQAFAYLAVRSYLKLPISFPETTGCKKPTIGGKTIKFK